MAPTRPIVVLALWLAATPAGAAEFPATPDPARVMALYGATLGMEAGRVRALAPSKVGGRACVPEGGALLLLIACGPYTMTAEFTAAGRAWHLRAAVDMTAALPARAGLERRLRRRFGRPTSTVVSGTRSSMVWLPGKHDAAFAERCNGTATLLAALMEIASRPPAERPADETDVGQHLPNPAAGCLPIRLALLAGTTPLTVRGLIIDTMDPRPRLAELPAAPAAR